MIMSSSYSTTITKVFWIKWRCCSCTTLTRRRSTRITSRTTITRLFAKRRRRLWVEGIFSHLGKAWEIQRETSSLNSTSQSEEQTQQWSISPPRRRTLCTLRTSVQRNEEALQSLELLVARDYLSHLRVEARNKGNTRNQWMRSKQFSSNLNSNEESIRCSLANVNQLTPS